MGRATTVVAALIAMRCGTQPRGAGQAPASATTCAQPGWTTPETVRLSDGRTVHVETPQVVELDDGRVLLLGSPVLVYSPVGQGEVRRVAMAGITLDRNGHAMVLAAPPGYTRGMYAPRALADPVGVNVVWGGRSSDTANLVDLTVGLWAARFEGGTWTRATRLVSDTVDWREQMTSPFVRQGEWAGVLASFLIPGSASLLVQRIGTTWRVDTVPFWGNGMSLAVTRSGLVASYIASAAQPELNGNTLWVVRSADRGRTWSSPHPVFFAREGDAMESRIEVRGDSLWLLWLQFTRRDTASPAPDSLGLSISTDGGLTWQRQRAVAVGARPLGLHVVTGRDGVLHATFRVEDGDSLVVKHAWWQSSQGFGVEQMPGPAASLPVIGIVRDSLWLLWTRMEAFGPRQRRSMLVHAKQSLACARMAG